MKTFMCTVHTDTLFREIPHRFSIKNTQSLISGNIINKADSDSDILNRVIISDETTRYLFDLQSKYQASYKKPPRSKVWHFRTQESVCGNDSRSGPWQKCVTAEENYFDSSVQK
jgi:hypothetical protein